MPGTWIKLNRNIVDWRWYQNANVKALFLHLLLKAAIKDGVHKDIEIQRGQVLTTLSLLSAELGTSVQTIRTGLNNLEKSGEITSRSCNKFTLITVNNYDLYQEQMVKPMPKSSKANRSKRKSEEKHEEQARVADDKYTPQEWELTIPRELWGRFGTEDEYWDYAAQGGEN